MEMVKVDIQKLQLLNDRIAQTLEALDQVRLSVHGIQHTGPSTPWNSAYGYPVPQFVSPAFSPAFSSFGSPYGGFSPYGSSFSPFAASMGIQHSSFSPYATRSPVGIAYSPYGQSPYGQSPYAQYSSPFGQYSNGAGPVVSWVNGGLSHTSAWDPIWRTQTVTPTLAGYPVPLS